MDVFPKIYVSHILRGQNAKDVKYDLLDQGFRRIGTEYRELVLMYMNGIELDDDHKFMQTTRIMMCVSKYISFSEENTERNTGEDPAGAAAASNDNNNNQPPVVSVPDAIGGGDTLPLTVS
ncbi:MAG: hypothetical protein ACKPKO_47255, partial [Candidatus Fonsibacter sp.]